MHSSMQEWWAAAAAAESKLWKPAQRILSRICQRQRESFFAFDGMCKRSLFLLASLRSQAALATHLPREVLLLRCLRFVGFGLGFLLQTLPLLLLLLLSTTRALSFSSPEQLCLTF